MSIYYSRFDVTKGERQNAVEEVQIDVAALPWQVFRVDRVCMSILSTQCSAPVAAAHTRAWPDEWTALPALARLPP